MASASITTKTTKTGKRRFAVRYRLGGRAYPVRNAGSFPTMKEARIRRDLVAGELAAGRNPERLLRTLTEAPARTRFADVAELYVASRIDLAASTQKTMAKQCSVFNATHGDRDPHGIRQADMQRWIGECGLKPTTLRKYLITLRGVFDFASVEPNPVANLRLPRQAHEEISPPSRREVAAILEHISERYRFAARMLEGTGLRVGELCVLEWGDIDFAEGRLRVRDGKTAAARRWVPVPAVLLEELADVAFDARRGRVFADATPAAVNAAVARACKVAGIPLYSPHDLRHRYISLLVKQGVPITTISAQVGHTSKTMTLDTYSHVLLDD